VKKKTWARKGLVKEKEDGGGEESRDRRKTCYAGGFSRKNEKLKKRVKVTTGGEKRGDTLHMKKNKNQKMGQLWGRT